MALRRETVEKAIAAYNKRTAGTAALASFGDAFVVVEFEGREFEFETEESFFDLKEDLEEAAHASFDVEKIEKLARTYRVRYAVAGKSPAEKIIDVLKNYDEGTPPRAPEAEDED